jgi:polysaccharide pyruvyl transferase CsaB
MPHLTLAGHFGCGNLGDDAILLGFVQEIGRDFDVTVLSGAPEETYRNYGLRSIPRMDMQAYRTELERTDALVFPGGSIFQDVTSVRSVAYYSNLVKVAKKAGKKVYLVGQGVGPLSGFFGKRMAASAFGAADQIVCRDQQSPQLLRTLGVKIPIQVGADCAFLLPESKVDEGSAFSIGNMRAVGIAPRPLGKDTPKMIQLFGEFARSLLANGYYPVFLEMDSKHDGPLLAEISKAQGGKVPEIRKLITPMQIQGRIGRMETVVAVRLHAGILATTMGIPPLMISYDPKVTAFSKALDFGINLNVQDITAPRLFENFQAFMKDRDRNIRSLERKREEFRNSAMLNVEVVRDGLRR